MGNERVNEEYEKERPNRKSDLNISRIFWNKKSLWISFLNFCKTRMHTGAIQDSTFQIVNHYGDELTTLGNIFSVPLTFGPAQFETKTYCESKKKLLLRRSWKGPSMTLV